MCIRDRNEQFAKVPDASDPEIKIAPPYNGATTKTNTEMPRSGQSSLRLIFHTIIYMRHTTYILQNTHTRNRNKATHTQMPPSGQSSLRLIFHTIIHMRHRTYRLQNTHAIETNKATHTYATVRSIFSQIDLQRNHSHAPHDLLPAKYTRNRTNATHTHMPHRQANLLSDRSSTQSFTCATRLTYCKIHTQ